jgi:hypothetical protein
MGNEMNAAIRPTSEVEQLVSYLNVDNAFDMPFSEALPRQLAAINERFQDRVGKIKLLQNRAETGGITEVREMADVVPLLFAHTAYKSYPESWLTDKKWGRMGRWLDTVSTHRVQSIDTQGIDNLDEWLQRLGDAGHHVSCSSGTTGKCAMMNATDADLVFGGRALLQAIRWAGLAPNRDRYMVGLGQVAKSPRNMATGRPMAEAFSPPDAPPFMPNVPPITIGGITDMVVMRKKIAAGTAKPAEVARFEAEAAERDKAVESAIQQAAEVLINNRQRKLHITGMFGPMYRVAELVRARGFTGKDFCPNTGFIGGGLKRVQLPANYREFVFETLNLAPERLCQAYGMQELNTTAVRCKQGRYHMAPWMMLLLLDESGDHLIEPVDHGELEGRAAFFDLSLEGRWGGVISGDKIRATWAPCACGNRSPSVNEDIQRYADMSGGDKIACAGTIDAYIRGAT